MQVALLATIASVATAATASPISSQKATYYDASIGIGACGKQLDESEMGVAVSTQMDCKALCGKSVEINSNGNTVSAPVVDCCPGCDGNHIDVTPNIFDSLDIALSEGVAPVAFSIEE
ncbi:hypothetical protein E3P99_02006 [Wallemia hederae]|uniref:RlpA-like protein double-psi beta-barrel domain-containing protein n=1 Tax=Wallemia hederae TaxID=1540922 RepID=A0A4T0FMK2_9BASI|nr:hypothetical protein E3P99_02006 [Wallemia hederae]